MLDEDNPDGAVWPPPPDIDPIWSGAFRADYLLPRYISHRVPESASVADFRSGHLELGPRGLHIEGRAVLPREVQTPWIVMAAGLLAPFFVVSILLEYVIRPRRSLDVDWQDIEALAVDDARRMVSIAYRAPNKRGKIIHNTLTIRVNEQEGPMIAAVAKRYATDRFAEAPMRFALHPHVRIFFTAVVIWLVVSFLAVKFLGLS
jgi:hypothetical protein